MSLAAALEVSEWTVRSDVDCLRDRYGAPLANDHQRGYCYTDPDWRLPMVPMTKGELFALTLRAIILEAYGGSLAEQEWLDLQQIADHRLIFSQRRRRIWIWIPGIS